MSCLTRFRIILASVLLLSVGCGDDGERNPAPVATPTVVSQPTPTVEGGTAAAGEAAFFDTLLGIEDRNEQAIALLSAAVRENSRDGRSWFLLGMMHLWRLAREWTDIANPSAFVRAEIDAAREALHRAVPLLPEDTRIPGFAAAATFSAGIIHNDAELRERGLQELRAAMDLNFLFNSFDFIGVVPPVVAPDDPLMAEAIEYLERGLTMLDQCTPRICGNEGYAPHNLEGTFVLFGDLYAKIGDAERARGFYQFAENYSSTSGWRFRYIVQQRVANVEQRVALYRDGDPSNDPLIVGTGPEACSYCHFR